MAFKIFLITILLSNFIPLNKSQSLFFPEDNDSPTQLNSATLAPIPKNLTELRGTAEYEKYIDQIIATGLLKLTLAINRAIGNRSETKFENVVYAPVSIGAALALVLLGANGKTFEELVNILGLASGQDIQSKTQIVHQEFGRMIHMLESTSGFQIGSQVEFATAVFVQNNFPIRSLYQQTAQSLYESEIISVNFNNSPGEAQQVINNWVTDRTKGKINDLLGEAPSSSTRIIIASAMYFKALWEFPFFQATKRRPFFTNGRQSPSEIDVDMMTNGGTFPYHKDTILNCEIIGFPYKGNQTTMYVVLPFDSNKEKLKQLEDQLTPTELERLVNSVVPTGSIILFPKMKIDSTIDLREALEKIGVKSLFIPSEANLALLSPGENQQFTPLPAVVPKFESTGTQANVQELEPNQNEEIFIFSRLGNQDNCSEIFNPNSTINKCTETNNQQKVLYKRFGNKVGRRLTRKLPTAAVETLDSIRQTINQQSKLNSYHNPGLYADKVIHKVFMDITESGTEAAAVTSVSLSRDGSRIMFRADTPFFYFIRHEETKTILFWGSVTKPTPSFRTKF